jgi:4-hydroxybenzoyl-CoA thioesterase/acyl-CoA thioester hydrolase
MVEFADTDMAGIMHFASFFRYMEAAEHELLRNLGFSVYTEIDGDVVTFPRVSASCEFHSPARCEDVLDIDVTVTRVGVKSITYGFRFTQQGRDVASGQMTSVCCRVPHGEDPISMPIPEVVADKLRTLARA